MENPHNSQDLFELLKRHLAGRRFVADAEVKWAVIPDSWQDIDILRRDSSLGATVRRTLHVKGEFDRV
jgi:hypothetical protein